MGACCVTGEQKRDVVCHWWISCASTGIPVQWAETYSDTKVKAVYSKLPAIDEKRVVACILGYVLLGDRFDPVTMYDALLDETSVCHTMAIANLHRIGLHTVQSAVQYKISILLVNLSGLASVFSKWCGTDVSAGLVEDCMILFLMLLFEIDATGFSVSDLPAMIYSLRSVDPVPFVAGSADGLDNASLCRIRDLLLKHVEDRFLVKTESVPEHAFLLKCAI